MIRSMTGFGKSALEYSGKKISVEIKSLNSKQFDANLRLPLLYREKEAEIRIMLSAGLQRGKVELNINLDDNGDNNQFQFNRDLAKKYFEEIHALADELKLSLDEQVINTIVRLPDVLKADHPELSTEEWNLVKEIIKNAIKELDQFRIQEGNTLANDLNERVNIILKLLDEISPLEETRIQKLRDRILKQIEDARLQGSVDMNRYEQEIIYYLEKLDITEEKVRLRKHCDYFNEIMAGEGHNGKKLGFVSQEMGREINTLGSKANDADIQKIVVLMKDELEKIKEQLFNIL